MNFLFHCWEYPPHPGGVGRYIRNMSEALAVAGHGVVAVVGSAEDTGEDAPEYEEKNGVYIHRCLRREELYTRTAADMVLELVAHYNVQLIEGADHLGSSAALLACTNRPPVVIKCHSCSVLYAAHEQAHALYSWQKWLIRLARLRSRKQAQSEQYSIEHANLLTVPSRIILKKMKEQGLRLPAQQMLVPNPIKPIARAALSAEAERPTLLYLGRLDIGKGIQYLPDILHFVLQSVPDVCLEIAGPDSYARGLGSLQQWLRCAFGENEQYVQWLGCLDEQEVEKALQRAWVVLVPSRWDTFPTVLLETMSQAKAAVVSDKGGIPEMVSGTDIPVCGPEKRLFAEKVIDLLRHTDKRRQVGASGYRKVVTSFSPETVVNQYRKMAEGVLASC
ncbi:MAG: glycosyltransferase family 4 protein [Candidatus Electrothrix gigas]